MNREYPARPQATSYAAKITAIQEALLPKPQRTVKTGQQASLAIL